MDTVSNQNVSIAETAANTIAEYTSQDGKSLRQIELYTHVSYSYIRRLSLGNIDDDCLDPLKLFQVIKFIKDNEYAYCLIERNPEWTKKVNSWMGLDKNLASKAVERQDLEYFITASEEAITVFILASNNNGVDLEALQEMGGKKLISACNRLIDNNILVVKNDKVMSNLTSILNGEFFNFSREALQKIVPVIIKNYKPEHAGLNRNYLFLGTEMFSMDFIAECYSKVEDLRNWYNLNSVKEENKGNNPFFLSMVMDTFTDKLISTYEVVQ